MITKRDFGGIFFDLILLSIYTIIAFGQYIYLNTFNFLIFTEIFFESQ